MAGSGGRIASKTRLVGNSLAKVRPPPEDANILGVHDVGQHEGAPYIVTELLVDLVP
jgi:hypothetical protein